MNSTEPKNLSKKGIDQQTKHQKISIRESNIALLNAIYYNIQMAITSIDDFLNCIEDDDFLNEISRQNQLYEVMKNETQMLAKANNIALEELCFLVRVKTWATIKITSFFNDTTRHYAHLMYIGTNMGIPEIIFAICDYPNATKSIIELAKKLREIEEDNVHLLKKYFCQKEPAENKDTNNNEKLSTNFPETDKNNIDTLEYVKDFRDEIFLNDVTPLSNNIKYSAFNEPTNNYEKKNNTLEEENEIPELPENYNNFKNNLNNDSSTNSGTTINKDKLKNNYKKIGKKNKRKKKPKFK